MKHNETSAKNDAGSIKINTMYIRDGKAGDIVTLKSGKTKNCTPGKTFACGSACFTLGRNCNKNVDLKVKEKATKLKETIEKPLKEKTTSQKQKKEKTTTLENSKKIIEKQTQTSIKNEFDAIDDPKQIQEKLNEWGDIYDNNLINNVARYKSLKESVKDFNSTKNELKQEPDNVNIRYYLSLLTDEQQEKMYTDVAKANNIETAGNKYFKSDIRSGIKSGKLEYTMSKKDLMKNIDNNIKEYENKIKDLEKELNKKGIANLDEDSIEKIADSIDIIKGINNAVLTGGKVKMLTDKKGIPQSSMAYREESDHIYIDLLATAPWNMLNNGDLRKTKGAGTNIIVEAIKESERLGKYGKIKLYPLPQSAGFYKKLGFEKDPSGGMVLSSENAKKLKTKITS